MATYSDHFSYFCMKAFGIDAHKARNNEIPWAVIEEKFPKDVNERDYMVEVSGYVGVWYNQAVIPTNITEIQKEALELLQQHKIVDFDNPDAHKLCVARIGWPHGIRKAKIYGDLMIKEE